jgi:hypothetical protein
MFLIHQYQLLDPRKNLQHFHPSYPRHRKRAPPRKNPGKAPVLCMRSYSVVGLDQVSDRIGLQVLTCAAQTGVSARTADGMGFMFCCGFTSPFGLA